MLQVRKSAGRGRGVFAGRVIKAGQVIEVVNVLLVPLAEVSATLNNYCFRWSERRAALALSACSLMNHSFDANCRFEFKRDVLPKIIFRAVKKIPVGEELFINYNGPPDCKEPVWFETI